MSTTRTIFVYGTLLRGQRNHVCLKGARWRGVARTEPGYALYSLGFCPALVRGGQGRVSGELYEVTPAVLARLDLLEGHPNFYCRTPIRLEDGTTAEAYLLPPEDVRGRRRIMSGSWREETRSCES